MSKKMLKRSLALGALMAFVITGSAMAAPKNNLVGECEELIYNGQEVNDAVVDQVVGGWQHDEVNEKMTSLGTQNDVTNVVVKSGSVEEIIGGNHVRSGYSNNIANSTFLMGETNILAEGNGVVAEYVIGGNKSTIGNRTVGNVSVAKFETKTTNLTIKSGTYGSAEGTAYAKKIADLIVGGDYIKSADNANQVTSHIENVNLRIDGGTFNAPIVGGSAVDTAYSSVNANKDLKATVENVNLTITGGTFNEGVFGGGLASWGAGEKSSTKVTGIVTMNITGGTFNDGSAIYSGIARQGNCDVSVNKAVMNIANVKNVEIYATNAIFDSNMKKITSSADENAWVDTDLTLTKVEAKTVYLPKGALTLNGANAIDNVTIGDKVTVNLTDGDAYVGEGKWAIDGKLIVNSDEATLTIGNIKAATYNIASDYEGTEDWTLKNELMDVESWNTNGQLQVTTKAKPGNKIAEQLGVSENTGNFVEDIISGGNDEATNFLNKLMDTNVTDEVRNDTLAAVQKMGEAGGNSATAASIVKNVTGVTNDRLSFNCGHSAPHKGGHGVGLFEEGSGADIWVEYVHGKDEVEDMPSTAGASSYEGQYNGLVMGVDFKKVGKFQSGIAFNYGEGDTNSVGSAVRTHSDYDFWGVGYYGNIHNDDSNIIFDINYAQTESDVTQKGVSDTLEASPETTTWSAGVKLEKLYQNENVQIVPYTGLRYMSIDSDDYATKGGGFMYNMERQNIWMLPVGVSIRQEIQNDNGWTVSPRVDLSYIWAFGDTNSNMEVKVGNGITPIGYDVMDDGSFLGLVGIEAHKGQWGYGIAYSYQKGDHSESKKWYVDVNYSF